MFSLLFYGEGKKMNDFFCSCSKRQRNIEQRMHRYHSNGRHEEWRRAENMKKINRDDTEAASNALKHVKILWDFEVFLCSIVRIIYCLFTVALFLSLSLLPGSRSLALARHCVTLIPIGYLAGLSIRHRCSISWLINCYLREKATERRRLWKGNVRS